MSGSHLLLNAADVTLAGAECPLDPGAFTTLDEDRIWTNDLTDLPPKVLGTPGQLTGLPDFAKPGIVTGDGLLLISNATDAEGGICLDKLHRSAHKRFVS